jgi:hypothetical protein
MGQLLSRRQPGRFVREKAWYVVRSTLVAMVEVGDRLSEAYVVSGIGLESA